MSFPEFSQVCDTHDECGDLLCVCGVCSARCAGDNDCTGLGVAAACEESSCSAGTACRALGLDSTLSSSNSGGMPGTDDSPGVGGTASGGGALHEGDSQVMGGAPSEPCQPGTLTVTLGPETDSAFINSLIDAQDHNYGGQKKTHATVWTNGGRFQIFSSLLRFELPELPAEVVLTSAELTLFPGLHEATYLARGGHGTIDLGSVEPPNNSAQFLPITEAWEEKTVTWNKQPSYSNEGAVSLDASTSYDQIYRLDLSNWAQEVIKGSRPNHGFMLKLDHEQPYASLYFNSPDLDPDLGPRPQLEMKYRCSK